MKITPFSRGCGAEVHDIQIAALSDPQLDDLRSAFIEHGLLFFRDQQLSPEEHLAFANRYGKIVLNKFFKPVPGHPQIAEVRKEKDGQTNIGGGWHTDHSYDAEPALGSILVARTLPQGGGDTRFANLCAAYAALPPSLKKRLSRLYAVHSNEHIYGREGYYQGTDIADQLGGADSVGETVHPAVIKHPDSGRPVLYVNPAHTIGVKGWGEAQSAELLQELYQHVDQPQFTCRFNWLPGSVAFWDNRCTWHFAQNDYHGEARLMHRITLAGTTLKAAD